MHSVDIPRQQRVTYLLDQLVRIAPFKTLPSTRIVNLLVNGLYQITKRYMVSCSRFMNHASTPAADFPPFEPFDFPHWNLASGMGHTIPVKFERGRRARRADDLAAVVTDDFKVIGTKLFARDDRGVVIDHFVHITQGDFRNTHR